MKISIISSTAAGRYCFFLGMVKNLLTECKNAMGYISWPYSRLYTEVFSLSDQTLSYSERIPAERPYNMIYELYMEDKHSGRIPIEWVDVKSGHVVQGCDDYDWNLVRESDCIMICMDGSTIAHATGSTQDIADYWYQSDGESGLGIDNFLLNYLGHNDGKLPFLCFVVTKIDTIDSNLVNSTRLDYIVKETFPQWFDGQKGHGAHIAAICPISALGYEFMDGGPFCPFNAEKPLLAALKVVCGKTYGDLKGVRFYKNGKLIDESEL